ncbi:acyl-CoA reductase [Fodinibius sp.]|uniref:acyl-CoA reductase n=1 Tax=Fodinibius sp. TaxID=1872440 RepID=UPI002ACD4466|nr:acyl-CoA reductase [Fodinibius sp.]MDZ7659759.1 acyl-CoA reductase [Fodinibius sp.]
MSDIQQRIDTLLKACSNWLADDNLFLKDAIDQTVREGYFSFEDVNFAIEAIRESISKSAIRNWVEQSGLTNENKASQKNVLCLHAGNLPLVGFQDAFATLLSGDRYTGKISRKDPYLLPTFLNEVKKTDLWSDRDVQWTHRLDDFEGMPHDAVIFAGSESSVPGVKEAIEEFNLAKRDAGFLIRTSHFSMAYLDRKDEHAMQNLTESIFRYGGKGCRSVAIVVSPFPLNEVKEELTDHLKSFWHKNPQNEYPSPKLKQQFAYNEAVERPQVWLEYFLLQEGGLELDQDFVCYWMQGDEGTVAELADKHRDELQSIYVTDSDVEISEWKERTELLSKAQQPPISWKPDGVDTLEWLIDIK